MSEPPFNESIHSSESPVTTRPVAERLPKSGWRRRLAALWTFIFRLLMLGVGVGLGWLAGLLLAEFFPARQAEPPLQEKVQRATSQTWRKLQQLPGWWRGEETVVLSPLPAPEPESVELSPAEAQLVESEVSAMLAELDALDRRLGDLEQRLGRQPSTAPPAVRLRRLDQTLSGEPTAASPPAPDSNEPAAIEATESTQLQSSELIRDRVTLPSSVLFAPEQAELTLGGEQILETILPDLARYPNATIVVGGYGDAAETAVANREQTFTQALAVQRYLESRLGNSYHWVSVGYGDVSPLTSEAASVRHRRVEIAIVPAQ